MYTAYLVLLCAGTSLALMCYEGTLRGLEDNSRRTEEKHCSPMSHYCVQKIDRKNKQIIRECSSFADEHNMSEKCPTTGCHWQSADETFCCCQFDGCNEWKSDGTDYVRGQTTPRTELVTGPQRFKANSSLPFGNTDGPKDKPLANPSFVNVGPTVRTPNARKDEIEVMD